MSHLDDFAILRHIKDSVDRMLEFTAGKTFDDINANYMLSYAVIRGFEIMGEACNKISKEFKDANPEIPWRQMIGFRNRLIHNYFDIDHSIVWMTIQEKLPDLKIKLDELTKIELKRKPGRPRIIQSARDKGRKL